MTMIIEHMIGGPARPRLASSLRARDREHMPHHLRPSEVATASLAVEMIFSPLGKWLEVRFEEEFLKAGTGAKTNREITKVISTTFHHGDLRHLITFFTTLGEKLDAEEALEKARQTAAEDGPLPEPREEEDLA